MTTSERARHQFYETVRQRLGDDEAEYLMSVLPPAGWAEVATKHDLQELESRLSIRINGVDGRIDGLGGRVGRLEDRIDSLGVEMRAQYRQLVGLIMLQMLAILGVLGSVLAT